MKRRTTVAVMNPATTAQKKRKRKPAPKKPKRAKRMTAAERAKLKPSEFARPELDGYPIQDAGHVRAATARLEQHKGSMSPAEYKRARRAIARAAKRLGVKSKYVRPASPAAKGTTMAKKKGKKGLTAKQRKAGFGGKAAMTHAGGSGTKKRRKKAAGAAFKAGHRPWNKGKKMSHWSQIPAHRRRTNPITGMGLLKVLGGTVLGGAAGLGANKGMKYVGLSGTTRAASLGLGGLAVGSVIGLFGAPVAGLAVALGLATAAATSAMEEAEATAAVGPAKKLKGLGMGEPAPTAYDMQAMGAVVADDMAEMGEMVRLQELSAVVADDMGALRRMYGDRALAEALRVA